VSVPTKPTNGKRTRPPLACPHSEECVAPKLHDELMGSIDDFHQKLMDSVGLLLEKQDLHSKQLVEVVDHLNNVAERQTKTDQREEEWLRQLAELTRTVAALRRREERDA
jgi:ABC-type transporter Mla subunit MlaD